MIKNMTEFEAIYLLLYIIMISNNYNCFDNINIITIFVRSDWCCLSINLLLYSLGHHSFNSA